jgi:hypothetical protein
MRAGVASAVLVAWLAVLAPSLALAPADGASAALGASETASSASPWFCHGLDCPPFAVERRGDGYETRVYPAGLRWTSTTVTGVSYDDAVSTGFMRLFRYISGANEAEEKIPMTAPVRVAVAPGDGPFCDSNFTVSFFVPFQEEEAQDVPFEHAESKTQRNLPKPTDPDVFESADAKETRVFVGAFGGYADAKALRDEAAALASRLEQDGVEVAASAYFYAGYDSPFRPIGRHNEVWLKPSGGVMDAARGETDEGV